MPPLRTEPRGDGPVGNRGKEVRFAERVYVPLPSLTDNAVARVGLFISNSQAMPPTGGVEHPDET